MQTHYDYLIIGSGLIGAIAALALAQKTQGHIALCEAKPQPSFTVPDQNSLDTRTLALNNASVQYLQDLSLWSALTTQACAIKKIHISEQGRFGSCLLDAQEIAHNALGYVIDINTLQQVLLKALTNYPSIHSHYELSVLSLKKIDRSWEVTVRHSEETKIIKATYVILADGRESQLRDQLGFESTKIDYQQSAIVAVAQCARAHDYIAYERFAGTKILAVLPLTHHRIGTVLSMPQAEVTDWRALSDAAYAQKIQNLLGGRLGSLTSIGPRQHYPLHSMIAKKFISDYLILLGNTAHTFNPIGAQGLNLGIANLKDFVTALVNVEPLEQVEARAQQRCTQLNAFTDQIPKIFSSDAWLTQHIRPLALFALQHSTVLKRRFIRRMTGVLLTG